MPFTSGSLERTLARIAFSCAGGRRGEHLARVGADRHRLRADRDLHAGSRSGRRATSMSESCGTASTKRVGGELDRLGEQALARRARPAAWCWRPRTRRACTPWRICAASSSEPANESFTSASAKSSAAGGERLRHRRGGGDHQPRLRDRATSCRRRRRRRSRRARSASAAPARAAGASRALHHHRGGLDRGGGRHAGRQPELLDGVARDRGGDAVRAGLDLHQRHHAVDLDRA